jgi:predicted GNAT family acetyltransferase
MGLADLQIGNVWTEPELRGRGLATAAICQVVTELAAPDRAFWYVTARENLPSVRAVERAGFELVGAGERIPRWGLRVLGSFTMDPAKR